METQDEKAIQTKCSWKDRGRGSGASNPVYGFGLIGALIYYLQHATSFGNGLLGVLKALVWPSVLVYELLRFLKL